jgi:hypothetical protein
LSHWVAILDEVRNLTKNFDNLFLVEDSTEDWKNSFEIRLIN